ncbi:hypothetical protein ACFWN5_41080 [Streptomyces sp. NPDC058430]|uniref:hypothetical protein n=1 Tax=Streptomyces sp. NPDC058430 TaxID=3346495 RepID=UPI00364F9E53
MSASSGTSSPRWLLEATCQSAPCDSPAWDEQRQLLASIGSYDRHERVWTVRIGVLDVSSLAVLNRLYEAARRFGTRVEWNAALAPDTWRGEAFEDTGELARLAAAAADRGRPLGQLPAG